MPVEFASPRPPGLTRCAVCGLPTAEPFASRGPCRCGSNGWITGPAMAWPPFRLAGQPSPHFLLGEFSRPEFGLTSEREATDSRSVSRSGPTRAHAVLRSISTYEGA